MITSVAILTHCMILSLKVNRPSSLSSKQLENWRLIILISSGFRMWSS